MSNYIKKYDVGNIAVQLPYNSFIHELTLLSFSDFRNSVNISLFYNHKLKNENNNLFNVGNGFKLNIQKRIVIDEEGNPIQLIDSNGKYVTLFENFNSSISQINNGYYTFEDEAKRILKKTTEGFELENEDLSKEIYDITGYIKTVYDKYGDLIKEYYKKGARCYKWI